MRIPLFDVFPLLAYAYTCIAIALRSTPALDVCSILGITALDC